MKNQTVSKKLFKFLGIAGSGAFLSCLIPAVFAQPTLSQDAPASQTTGGARADEAGGFANPSTRTNDPALSVPGQNPSMQNNMPQTTPRVDGTTQMDGSNSLQNYSRNMGRESSSVTISQWPKNRIEKYTFPNSTNPSNRIDGTNYIGISPESSQSVGISGMNQPLGVGGGAGGVSGQMNQQMNRGGSTAPNLGNTTAPSGGRINDQFTAPNENMPGQSSYDSPNVRSQQMNEGAAGVGGGAGGTRADEVGGQIQQAPNRVDDPVQQQNQTGQYGTQTESTTIQRQQQQQQQSDDAGAGGGTGGAVPGLW